MQFIIDSIHEEDGDFLDSDKTNNKYYIGIKYDYLDINDNLIFSSSVSPIIFFKYSITNIMEYLYFYSNNIEPISKVDIMQLQILEDETYTVILKTYWIRLIQRHWRSLLMKRAQIIKKRCTLKSLKYFEIHGRYLPEYKNFPSLNGMLKMYNNK